MTKDAINPDHYKSEGKMQVIDFIEAFDLNFSRGNAVKYIARAGVKYDSLAQEIEDLEKAIWYITRERDRVAEDLRKMRAEESGR